MLGSAAIVAVNPIVAGVSAFVCYRLYKSRKAIEDAERAQKRADDRADFREKFYARQRYASYDEYLASDVWRAKRAQVIARCGGKCETSGCERDVEEVHHSRYPRILGNEPIQWLVALCSEHHRAAHGLSRQVVRR